MAYLEVTIDSSLIDSDLTNFPVGIKLDSSDSILSGLSATDWQYLHVTVLDVECFVEVDIWDMTSDTAVIWVKVPSVASSSDTTIKLEITTEKNDFITVSSTPLVWDDFTGNDDDDPNPDLWNRWETGCPFNIQSNKLQSSHTGVQNTSWVTKGILSGDFDVQIDYEILTGPSTNRWILQFTAAPVQPPTTTYILIDRRYDSGHKYYSNIYLSGSIDQASTSTSDMSGKLRIVRSGSNVTVYYHNGTSWVAQNTRSGYTTADMYISLRSITTSSMTFQATYDNFTINSCDGFTGFISETGDVPAQNVWDSNFVAVYHMSQDPSASDILDSTSNGYDLTPNGSMTSGDLVDCNFGKGIEFDGSNDVLKRNSITFSPSLSFPITLESYGKSRSTSFGSTYSNPYVTLTDASESDQFLTLALYNNATRTYKYNTSIIVVDGSTSVGTSEEITLAARFVSNTSLRLYLNGAYENEGTTSLALPSGIDSISIGGPIDSTPAYYQGIASDYRISNTDRSEAWIKATYHVFNDGLLTKTFHPDTPVLLGIYGQISISGKNVNIISVSLVEKGKWRSVEEIYMLNDGDWRQNIKS